MRTLFHYVDEHSGIAWHRIIYWYGVMHSISMRGVYSLSLSSFSLCHQEDSFLVLDTDAKVSYVLKNIQNRIAYDQLWV